MTRILIAAVFAIVSLGAAFAHAQPFYQGKTIRVIVGYLAGDSHDQIARAYTRHMGKHIPGNPDFVVQNMPGAGSMIAANHIYNLTKPDGLTLGSIAPGLYYAQLTGRKEVQFDWAKFTWIGSPESNGHLLFMRADAPYKTLDDVRNAKEPPKCSATGVGTSGHDVPKLLEETLGLKFNVITGYPGGGEQDLALERGEVQCRAITIAAFFSREPFLTWYKKGFVRVMIQTARQRNPKIADVPTIFELMERHKTPEVKRRQATVYLGAGGFGSWPIVSTPGVPAERVKILRDAYAKTLRDPDFVEEAKKRGWELKPVSGEDLQALAREVVEQPPEVVEWLKKLLAK
ncbi:MAG TPA: tripartite tricarboxylate transporter substrate-binding protein [Candidatus Acidoferrales bacterium]|nr:tripartite tricarboxylate transporter substrate-binding protein [Candidatus Acidoferrales bacterium]